MQLVQFLVQIVGYGIRAIAQIVGLKSRVGAIEIALHNIGGGTPLDLTELKESIAKLEQSVSDLEAQA